MFNYYFENEREAQVDTVKLFEEIKAGKYQAFTSVYTIEELMKATETKRKKMIAIIEDYGIKALERSKEAEGLAHVYLDDGIIPKSSYTDALHIAIATVNDIDMIISLNFRHIVRKKTIEGTEYVNSRNGYRRIQIFSPMEVVEREDT